MRTGQSKRWVGFISLPYKEGRHDEGCDLRASDTHGTVWDSVFTFVEREGKTELTMVMDAKARKLGAKLMNPLVKGMVKKAIEADLDAVKAYCEEATSTGS